MTAAAARCPGSGARPHQSHKHPANGRWAYCHGCHQPRKLTSAGRFRIHAVNPKTAALNTQAERNRT